MKQFEEDKLPPSAEEIEEAVLGICMLFPDALNDLRLLPCMFYSERHQKIFNAILEVSKKGSACDTLTVTNYLKERNELSLVGGVLYITNLTAKVFSDSQVLNYALIIREKYMRREYIRLSFDLKNKAFDNSIDLGDVVEFAETELFKLTDITQVRESEKLEKLIAEQIDEINKIINREKKLTGVPSAYTKIDRITGGWQEGNFIVIAARPSMGKTALALNLALNAASLNYPVAFFSLEMSKAEIANRALSYISGYTNIQLRNAEVNIEKLCEKSWDLCDKEIYVDDTSALSLFELRSKVKKLIVRKNIKLVIVDYLQLMRGVGNTREEEVSNISKGLKSIAKEFSIPVIALSQLNRKVEERRDRRPNLSDLRESGSIEQDADIVWLLWRPAYFGFTTTYIEKEEVSTSGLLVVEIAKNRNGATGDFYLWHNESMTVIEDTKPELINY